MAKVYQYYGVKDDYAWTLRSNNAPANLHWYQPRLFGESDIVWCQGPMGGIRVVHRSWFNGYYARTRRYGYIANNPQAMEEFMWIKLKAVDLTVK